MYIDIGQNKIINGDKIIGIFDLDTATVSKKTRDFLKDKELKKEIVYVNIDLPKSFILYNNEQNEKVFVCQYLPSTIIKRIY